MNTILVYSAIGEMCNFFHDWSKGRDKNYKCAFTYYGDNDLRKKEIESTCDYFSHMKGIKFNNFVEVFDSLPKFDYYALLDDDLNLVPEQIKYMVSVMSERGYTVGSPSHSSQGRMSWEIMRTVDEGEYRESDFLEMTGVIFSHDELVNFLNHFIPYKDKIIGWGTDYIIHSVCKKPFVIFDNVSVINQTNQQKGVSKREIECYIGTQNPAAMWEDVLKCPNNNFKTYIP